MLIGTEVDLPVDAGLDTPVNGELNTPVNGNQIFPLIGDSNIGADFPLAPVTFGVVFLTMPVYKILSLIISNEIIYIHYYAPKYW